MTEPIACTLTAAEYRNRTADLRRCAREALRERRPIAGGARLTFDLAARERLEALVAAEAECCPFLTMDLRLVLDVTGPAAAAPIIAELLTG